MSVASVDDAELLTLRQKRSAEDLWEPLTRLYGDHPDFERFRTRLEAAISEGWAARPKELRRLDLARDLEPDWFQRPDRVGYVFYVDRFAGNLRGVLDHVDHLKRLGVTYVHFMPCLKPRDGANDGGYSVQNYREIAPALGTVEDFEAVAAALRSDGIGVCIDMVLNHTAREHAWAEAAREGDPVYRDYYLMFDDETLPRQYEETLVEVFPDDAPGSFTYDPEAGAWVWTTFHTHQWDLNWRNPQVFLEIFEIMAFLLNKGAETLRLDAVAFMWKEMGTVCQNLPPVHDILQALRAATRIMAPGTLLKAEAIVAPRDLVPYLGTGAKSGKVSNLAYHNNLMVQFWSSLAARDVRMMRHVLTTHFPTRFENAAWATYLRCHDDIGWAITEEDAAAVGWSGPGHRAFLADFYEGVFPGSFATGALFQVNPDTGDKRNNGTMASLAGLERAKAAEDPVAIGLAIRRILMGHALIASWGGVPLLYMGDEIGLLNTAPPWVMPDGRTDTRLMQRPVMDWTAAEEAVGAPTPEGRIFRGIADTLARRAATPELHAAYPTEVLAVPSDAVLVLRRGAPAGPLFAVFNFSETPQTVPLESLRAAGLRGLHDQLRGVDLVAEEDTLWLDAYAAMWLL